MNARGFTLVELLIAALVVITLAGAVFTLVAPTQGALQRWYEGMDMETGARAALDQIAADVREAGADASVMPIAAKLPRGLPAVVLLSDLDTATFASPASALLVRRIPHLAAQARLRNAASAGAAVLILETDSACAHGGPACGFQSGEAAVLFDDASAELVAVQLAGAGAVQLTAPLAAAFPVGATLAGVVTTAYGLRSTSNGSQTLVRRTAGGAEQPLVDNVATLQIEGDDPDPSRLRRVSVTLRVEASSDAYRGSGDWFARPGTATHLSRWVPDVELRADIALRNRGGFR
jgi:hypothetical protein